MNASSLKEEMKTDAETAHQKVATAQHDIDEAERKAKKLGAQLDTPVSEENKALDLDQTKVGNVLGLDIEKPFDTKYEPYKSNTKAYTPKITNDDPVILNTEDDLVEAADQSLAYFSDSDEKVHRVKFVLSDEMKERINPTNSSREAIISGAAPYAILVEKHEGAHYEHSKRGQTDDTYATPEMAIEKDYATEKVARATDFLALANVWKQCHDAGIEYYQHDGKDIPLNDLLNIYPSLKEEVEKNGFDPKSEESVRRVVKLSSQYFDEKGLEPYSQRQFTPVAQSANCSKNLMNQIMAARGHEQSMRDMTKNLDIGYGMRIDFPEDCVDLVIPDKSVSQKILNKSSEFWSAKNTESLLAIDKHLDGLGLKNDKAKDAYLKEQYTKIINRAPDADLKLKELMVNTSSDDKSIVYTDDLTETRIGAATTVSNDGGKTSVTLSPMDKRLDERTENPAHEATKQAPENTAPAPKKEPLSPAVWAALQQRNR